MLLPYRQSVDGVAIKLAAFQFFVLGGYYISTNNEEDTLDGILLYINILIYCQELSLKDTLPL